jgi:hypothetical protein
VGVIEIFQFCIKREKQVKSFSSLFSSSSSSYILFEATKNNANLLQLLTSILLEEEEQKTNQRSNKQICSSHSLSPRTTLNVYLLPLYFKGSFNSYSDSAKKKT